MGALLAPPSVLKAPGLRKVARLLAEWVTFVLLFLFFALGLVAL